MLHAFDDRNYTKVLLDWSAINSLMPEEYKVEINTKKFYELIAENKVITCNKCQANDIKFQDIKIIQVLLTPIQTMITQKKYESIWYCPKCGFDNIFDQRQIKLVKFEEPYYTEVIPDPPKRKFGISDRATYDNQFKVWFARALDEIESKIGKYRADYLAQEAHDGNLPVLEEEHESGN